MESKEIDELIQRINSMQSEIDQQKTAINSYQSKLAEIKGDLLSQEHRFLPAWMNLISHFKNREKDHFKDKLSAVVQGFIPGTKSAIVMGGSIIGLLTLVLMYQSNQLMLLQNQYLQKQIYIQADSDRQDKLANITEILYEPSDDAIQRALTDPREKDTSYIEPKHNAQTRSQSVKAYLSIIYNPLEPVQNNQLSSISSVTKSLWNSLWSDDLNNGIEVSNEDRCRSINDESGFDGGLAAALLTDVNLSQLCMRYIDFSAANLNDADLSGANLENALFLDSKMIGTELSQVKMKLAYMDSADLTNANFAEAELIDVAFINAILKNANFRGSDLKDADLDLSDVEGADFRRAKNFTCVQLVGADNWKKAKTDLKCEEPAADQ